MLRLTSHLLVALAFLLALTSLTSAQPPSPVECPAIDVEAPLHALPPDEDARFTVRITPKKPEWKFRYHWTLTHGQPLTGQGTDTITVQRPPGSVVDATVNIAGGPDDSMCPVVSTERVVWISTPNEVKPAECPTLEVNGPAGPVDGELIKFKAKVANAPAKPLKYEWTVSKGQIIDGQGTAEITVFDTARDGSLTATVDVIGLPKGCGTTASETTPTICRVSPILIDEVEQPITTISEHTLRIAAEEQRSNPGHNLYIIAYSTKDVSQFDVRRAVKKVADFFIKEMKLTSDDFEIETVRSEANSVKIYRLPPGAERPKP